MKIIQLDRKPRKGDRLGFGKFTGPSMAVEPPQVADRTVTSISETNPNLCWALTDGQRDAQPFIWWFEREQMFNQLAHRFEREASDLPGSPEGQQAGVSSPPSE